MSAPATEATRPSQPVAGDKRQLQQHLVEQQHQMTDQTVVWPVADASDPVHIATKSVTKSSSKPSSRRHIPEPSSCSSPEPQNHGPEPRSYGAHSSAEATTHRSAMKANTHSSAEATNRSSAEAKAHSSAKKATACSSIEATAQRGFDPRGSLVPEDNEGLHGGSSVLKESERLHGGARLQWTRRELGPEGQ